MPTITEHAAQRYAAAVIDVLSDHFPAVNDDSLGRTVRTQLARQTKAQQRWFELIVTYMREWRLHAVGAGGEPWRVELVCHKDHPTGKDVRFEESVNARLRAIELED